jgi:hypothetical protein
MTSFSTCDPCLILLDLGCFNACGEIELPMYAPVNGTYVIMYYKQGVWIRKNIMIENAPERFTISNFFPENSESEFKIIDPDGNSFKYNYLRDKMGVKDIPNPPDDGCCTPCITHFKIKTVFNFEMVDEVESVFNNFCESEELSS